MDFWNGLLAGWGSTFNSSMKDARDRQIRDRQYELEREKFEEDKRYKQEQQSLLKPYYEAHSRLYDSQAKTAEQKLKMLDDVMKTPNPSESVVTPSVSPSNNTDLAPWVTEESYNRVSAVNPKDGKGSSFGLIQANAPDTQERMFRNSGLVWDEDGQRKSWLPDVPQTDPKFHAAFKQYTEASPEWHKQQQLKTAQELYRDPMIAKAKELGLDMSNKSIENAVVSAAIQHGNNGAMTILNEAKNKGDFSTPENAINSIFKIRATLNPQHSDRYERERVANLALLKNGTGNPSQPGQDGVLPPGSYQVASKGTGTVTDLPSTPGPVSSGSPVIPDVPNDNIQSRNKIAQETARSSRPYGNMDDNRILNEIDYHTRKMSAFKSNGLEYPEQAKLYQLNEEMKARREFASSQEKLSLSQKAEQYIDMKTGEIRNLTPLEYGNADPNRYQLYDTKQGSINNRIQQRETVISNLVDNVISDPRNKNFFINQDGSEMSLEDKQRMSLGILSNDKRYAPVIRSFTDDLNTSRTLPTSTTKAEDMKGNKVLVEGQYVPSTEKLAGLTADVNQYNSVGHEKVKNAYNLLTTQIEDVKNGFMSQGLDETKAYEAAKKVVYDTNEGKQALSTLESAYNGSYSPIKSGRVTQVGNNPISRGQEKELVDHEKSIAVSEMSKAGIKDALMTKQERLEGKQLTDDEIENRVEKDLKYISRKTTDASNLISKFMETGDTSLLSKLGNEEDVQRITRLMQNLRQTFLAKRKEITGVAFSQLEAQDLAKAFLNPESSPQEAKSFLRNGAYETALRKDYVESMRKTGSWNAQEAAQRISSDFEKKRTPINTPTESKGENPTPSSSKRSYDVD